MKTLSLTIIGCILLFAGCKKELSTINQTSSTNTAQTSPAVTSPIYLLNKATYLIGGKIANNGYHYDDKNRLTYVFLQRSAVVYRYNYDDNDNLVSAYKYRLDGTTLYGFQTFTYSTSSITVNNFRADSTSTGSCSLILNAKNQVTSLSCDPSIKYLYDSKSNVTDFQTIGGPQYSYLYDTSKHPLSMIGAKNIHLMYLAEQEPQTLVNNVIAMSHDNIIRLYLYKYNAAGFPVSAQVASNEGNYTITYQYLVK